MTLNNLDETLKLFDANWRQLNTLFAYSLMEMHETTIELLDEGVLMS